MAAGKEEGEPGGWLGDLRASRLFLRSSCVSRVCEAASKGSSRRQAGGAGEAGDAGALFMTKTAPFFSLDLPIPLSNSRKLP
jgi:hypothetical protein